MGAGEEKVMPSAPKMVEEPGGEDEEAGPRADLLWRPASEAPAYSVLKAHPAVIKKNKN